MKSPLIVLAGPTAVGKSALALALAQAIGGEIISADSVQVYRGLDIGTAKLSLAERQGVPHHLIDILEPEESFDVLQFQQRAREAIGAIQNRGHLPILCGGTGFYVQAVTRDIHFSSTVPLTEARMQWMRLAEQEGAAAVHRELAAIDPEAAQVIHPHNLRRSIRALEYYAQTGEKISAHNREEKRRTSPYRLVYLALSDTREHLYRRIDRRVAQMMEKGLEKEVRILMDRGLTEEKTSMKAIGYKEFFPYFRGEYDQAELIRRIRRNTRHYAKRQWTWFRSEPEAIWVDTEAYDYDEKAILSVLLQQVRDAKIF